MSWPLVLTPRMFSAWVEEIENERLTLDLRYSNVADLGPRQHRTMFAPVISRAEKAKFDSQLRGTLPREPRI